VVAYRQFFSTFGGLAAYAIGFGLFFQESARSAARGQFRAECLQRRSRGCVAVRDGGLRSWLSALRLPRSHRPFLPLPMVDPIRRSRLFGSGSRTYGLAEIRRGTDAIAPSAWLFVGVLIVFMMVGVDSAP
jgi:hypothetical protein